MCRGNSATLSSKNCDGTQQGAFYEKLWASYFQQLSVQKMHPHP